MAWFVSPQRLKALGVLAMNRRNIDYIFRYNPRSKYPLVDDKLKTKQLVEAAGLATPSLIGVVRYYHQVGKILDLLQDKTEFAIKPAKGSAGNGILLIKGRKGNAFVRTNGKRVEIDYLRRHVSNILSGLHSLGGQQDCAMIESLVHFDPRFAGLAAHGVPDLRVIVFRGYPVMAMLRIPTLASDGKANLHQGAVGVGLDMATGCGLVGVQYDRVLQEHPDLALKFSDIKLDGWGGLLELAARAYDVTGLGYLGVDLVLDEHYGPQILELNARPGLAIQLANHCGLLNRLKRIENLRSFEKDIEPRVASAREWFGGSGVFPAD
jgi:alpha-L-glutamate ligase-like protein